MKIKRGLISLLILLVLTVALFTGCSQTKTTASTATLLTAPETANVPMITVSDANTLIQTNKGNPGFVLLDVRTAGEFNSGHIAGAMNLDYYASDFKANIAKLDKNKQYLVYCRTGIRGAASVQIMLDLMFTRTQNMAGGITEWIQEGFPMVK
jgi:rhodanese-related sulfurtransferase